MRRLPWLAVAVVAVQGCAFSVPGPEVQAHEGRLRVAAASDLQSALPDVVARFQKARPGRQVEVVYGSSGELARQIRAGAPYDLFLSANEAYVKELAGQGHVLSNSVRPYAIGALVLAVNRAADPLVSGLDGLARPEVKRVAIADPDVAPYGVAARSALIRSGLWERVEPKVVRAGSVRQALRYVQTGDAEAGLVSLASADVPEVRVLAVDPGLHDPIVQSLGQVSGRGNEALSGAFVRFLSDEAGRSVLESHGFRVPSSP